MHTYQIIDRGQKVDIASNALILLHGRGSNAESIIRSQQSKELMEKLGAQVTLKVYEGMGHTINADEIDWVKKFMSHR